jgi:hypothetical protein
LVVVIGPVWQTAQAVGTLPPWAATTPLRPPPFEVLWQTLQLPKDITLAWY